MLERDEDVTINSHENHRQHGNANVAVEYEWKDLTQKITESPRTVIVANG
jgi:hypothetical protein